MADNPFESDATFDDVNLLGGGGGALNDPSVQGHLHGEVALEDFDDEQVIGSTEMSGQIAAPAPAAPKSAPAATARRDEAPATSRSSRMCSFLAVEFYQPYFDVNTQDVKERLKRAIMPWKSDFFEVLDGRPDLYGPFWICTTLVFVIAATSNLLAWFHSDASTLEPWNDYTVLSYGASLVFGFAGAMPFVAWACFSYLGVSTANVTFAELACVYGYSIFAFIFACVLCMIPFQMVEWASMGASLAFSTIFLTRNLWERLGHQMVPNDGYMPPMATGAVDAESPADGDSLISERPGRKGAAILLLGMVGLHVVFAMILKLHFFGGNTPKSVTDLGVITP